MDWYYGDAVAERGDGVEVKLSGVEQCVLLQCELSGGDVGGYKMVHLQWSHILV